MDYQHTSSSSKKSLFEALPSRTSFILGFIIAFLTFGTIGFFILGGYLIVGGYDISEREDVAKAAGNEDTTAPTTAPTAAAIPVVTDTDHIRGNKDAKVTIIEYSDFECSFCTRFHPTVKQALDEFGDDVRWVYRHFPLSFHANAESAAVASECAGQQGKFWEYADALFENQGDLGEDLYKKLANDLKLNANTFTSCLKDSSVLNHVRTDAQAGATAGVTGTPGSFVIDEDGNATPIKGAQPYSSLKTAIEAAL